MRLTVGDERQGGGGRRKKGGRELEAKRARKGQKRGSGDNALSCG